MDTQQTFYKKKSYKFTDKKQSVRGIISLAYLMMSIIMVGYAIYISYKADGQAGTVIGALGIMSLIMSGAGIAMGVYGFKEGEVFLKIPWIGTVGNTIMVLFLLGTILIGL